MERYYSRIHHRRETRLHSAHRPWCHRGDSERNIVGKCTPSGAANASGISVYLQKKGGDIIACEQIAPSGDYRFENVPLGSYEILVNVDGFIQEQTTEVTLTNDQPTVSDVDYYVNEDNTITTTPGSQTPTAITSFKLQQGTVVYDLQGRRLEAPQKGVNIIKFPDGKTRQVVIK